MASLTSLYNLIYYAFDGNVIVNIVKFEHPFEGTTK